MPIECLRFSVNLRTKSSYTYFPETLRFYYSNTHVMYAVRDETEILNVITYTSVFEGY
jgi:hypothetical protein